MSPVEFAAFAVEKPPKEPAPVWIFHGSEAFLRDEGLALVKQRWPDLASNALRLPSSDLAWPALASELYTASFFGGRKLITLADEGNFLHNNLDAFKEYAKSPSPSAVLVALVPGDKALGVKESASVRLVECKPLKSFDLQRFTQSLFQRRGRTIDRAALETLCLRGGELAAIAGHVEKLCTFAGKRTAITAADVAAHVKGEPPHKDYELALAAAKKQPKKAIELACAMIDAGEPAQKILWKLAWQYRKMVEAKKLLGQGRGRGEVTSLLQITFFQEEFLGLVASHTLGELLDKHGEILKADLALKTSGGMEAVILEGLVARLSSKLPVVSEAR
mgnify:CR=1 FL=1